MLIVWVCALLAYMAGMATVLLVVRDSLPEDVAGRYMLFLLSVFWPLTVAVAAWEAHLKNKRKKEVQSLYEMYQRESRR